MIVKTVLLMTKIALKYVSMSCQLVNCSCQSRRKTTNLSDWQMWLRATVGTTATGQNTPTITGIQLISLILRND
jgi:hypothetical protein